MFPNVLVGSYTITVEKDGFKKAVQKGVAVSSNQVAEAKVVMELGSVSAVVEVEANADLVKTQSSELGATFSGLAVHDVPINTLGGDVKEFSVYAPGTTTQQGGVLGSGAAGWAAARALLPSAGISAQLFVGAALAATSVGVTARTWRSSHPE